MILSNVVNNTKQVHIFKLLNTIKFLRNTDSYQKPLNNTSQVNSSSNYLLNKNRCGKRLVNQNAIKYIINVVLSSTNTIVNVTDIKGNVIISMSAGSVNLRKFQKKSQPLALIHIFKALLLKAKFLQNKTVALHFKNVKRFNEFFFLRALKKKLFIKSFQSNNLLPHNGCRPKKIKRIKRRTKRLVLK